MYMRSLSEYKLKDIIEITNTEEQALEWCFDTGILQRRFLCSCGAPLKLRKRNDAKNKGYSFRCASYICRKDISVFKESIFEGTHITVSKLVLFLYLWVKDFQKENTIMVQCEFGSKTTIVASRRLCRSICSKYFIDNPVQIGGPGRIVEIDECMLVRRKYERGRLVNSQWGFGGYDVEAKVGFMVPVPHRNADTLLPIIAEYILPGTTIISDLWRAYSTLSNIGFVHLTVNHSIQFVNHQNNATTNHIESKWQKVKQKHKERYGTKRTELSSYLDEFMWRERFKQDFGAFIEQIRTFFN